MIPETFNPPAPKLPLQQRTGLVVSVRDGAEARAALDGGAAIIDVKEPSRGSLGRADDATIAEVLHVVAGRRPVSAALGELRDRPPLFPASGIHFVKWGLSGLSDDPSWAERLAAVVGELAPLAPASKPVAVAYADWRRASAPPVLEVLEFAAAHRWEVLLVDTWRKDGTTLRNWLSPGDLRLLCTSCRAAGVRVALAGSLGLADLEVLAPLRPNWFAVRGAACRDGDRTSPIDSLAVRRLVRVLEEADRRTSCED